MYLVGDWNSLVFCSLSIETISEQEENPATPTLHSPEEKTSSEFSKSHQELWIQRNVRNQDSVNPDLESALIIYKQSSVGEG